MGRQVRFLLGSCASHLWCSEHKRGACVRTHTTRRPIMPRTLIMNVKSVRAGEYTAPPAHGPIISEICGITPEDMTLRCVREDASQTPVPTQNQSHVHIYTGP